MKKQSFLTKSILQKSKWFRLYLFISMSFAESEAFASTTSTLPFVGSLAKVADAISGPFMFSGAIIMIAITAFASAFGEFSEGMKRLVNITFWISLGFGASSLISNVFATGSVF